MGKPKKIKVIIDEQQVRELAGIDCTSAEMASVLRCKEGTLLRKFAGVIKQGRLMGKMSLRRKQFQVAMAGNVQMLIWLGKQRLEQADKFQTTTNSSDEGFVFIAKKG